MIKGRLVSRNGNLFVLYSTTHENEPRITHLWWRVESVRGTGYERPEEGDLVSYQSGQGAWTAQNPETLRRTGDVYTGSDTEAEFRETVSVPTPRVRRNIETRWHRGRWEKLLKRGWVPA